MPLLPIALLGFFLGMRHATDPDHVIAVTTIVSRQGSVRRAAAIGILWGLGHTLTIALVGGAIILFGLVIPQRVGLTMEFAVALMLIVLGTGTFWATLRATPRIPVGIALDAAHSHLHQHGDFAHTHPHGHGSGQHGHRDDETPTAWLDRTFGGLGFYSMLRPMIVGVVHGLAGSAAVALLVLTTVRSTVAAVAYLLVFGLGTIVGMMLITATLSLPFSYASRRLGRVNRFLGFAAPVVSLLFGLFLAYRIGIVHGLFSEHPQWTPE